jgi:hypothetical protein
MENTAAIVSPASQAQFGARGFEFVPQDICGNTEFFRLFNQAGSAGVFPINPGLRTLKIGMEVYGFTNSFLNFTMLFNVTDWFFSGNLIFRLGGAEVGRIPFAWCFSGYDGSYCHIDVANSLQSLVSINTSRVGSNFTLDGGTGWYNFGIHGDAGSFRSNRNSSDTGQSLLPVKNLANSAAAGFFNVPGYTRPNGEIFTEVYSDTLPFTEISMMADSVELYVNRYVLTTPQGVPPNPTLAGVQCYIVQHNGEQSGNFSAAYGIDN